MEAYSNSTVNEQNILSDFAQLYSTNSTAHNYHNEPINVTNGMTADASYGRSAKRRKQDRSPYVEGYNLDSSSMMMRRPLLPSESSFADLSHVFAQRLTEQWSGGQMYDISPLSFASEFENFRSYNNEEISQPQITGGLQNDKLLGSSLVDTCSPLDNLVNDLNAIGQHFHPSRGNLDFHDRSLNSSDAPNDVFKNPCHDGRSLLRDNKQQNCLPHDLGEVPTSFFTPGDDGHNFRKSRSPNIANPVENVHSNMNPMSRKSAVPINATTRSNSSILKDLSFSSPTNNSSRSTTTSSNRSPASNMINDTGNGVLSDDHLRLLQHLKLESNPSSNSINSYEFNQLPFLDINQHASRMGNASTVNSSSVSVPSNQPVHSSSEAPSMRLDDRLGLSFPLMPNCSSNSFLSEGGHGSIPSANLLHMVSSMPEQQNDSSLFGNSRNNNTEALTNILGACNNSRHGNHTGDLNGQINDLINDDLASHGLRISGTGGLNPYNEAYSQPSEESLFFQHSFQNTGNSIRLKTQPDAGHANPTDAANGDGNNVFGSAYQFNGMSLDTSQLDLPRALFRPVSELQLPAGDESNSCPHRPIKYEGLCDHQTGTSEKDMSLYVNDGGSMSMPYLSQLNVSMGDATSPHDQQDLGYSIHDPNFYLKQSTQMYSRGSLRRKGLHSSRSEPTITASDDEDIGWYKRPDIGDSTLDELCDISSLHKSERHSKLIVDFQEGISFPLGEGGRELLRACLNAKGCKGRQLQGASVPMLLQLARDWGLWNIAVRIKVERATGEFSPNHDAFVRFKAMQSQLRKHLKREQMLAERDDRGKITHIRFEEMKYLTLGKDGREKLRSQLRRMHDKDPQKMDGLLERNQFKYSELRNATVPQLLKLAHICGMWDEVVDACRKQEQKKDERTVRREFDVLTGMKISSNNLYDDIPSRDVKQQHYDQQLLHPWPSYLQQSGDLRGGPLSGGLHQINPSSDCPETNKQHHHNVDSVPNCQTFDSTSDGSPTQSLTQPYGNSSHFPLTSSFNMGLYDASPTFSHAPLCEMPTHSGGETVANINSQRVLAAAMNAASTASMSMSSNSQLLCDLGISCGDKSQAGPCFI